MTTSAKFLILTFVTFSCAFAQAQAQFRVGHHRRTTHHRHAPAHTIPSTPVQVCGSVLHSYAVADRVCHASGHSLLRYTDLQFSPERHELTLGYGCDCGGPYHRPAEITNPMLCIRKEDSPDACINYDCDRGDRSPWCDDGER